MAASLVFRLHDGGPELVREVLLERGWEEYDEGRREVQDWNLYWRGSAFRSSDYDNLLPWQRLNHHPQTVGVTRKDCLARNLRRMRAAFGSAAYDFSPAAFILPNDYTRFLEEYSRLRVAGAPPAYWICKPADLSRGRGIFVFKSARDLVYDGAAIVQRYISDPLLISGYKFDLRIYVCVKSFSPLSVYIHQEGLVRFATEKYDLSSLGNLYAHLTNTSINKSGPFYRSAKGRVGRGCKWTMSEFRRFLSGQGANEVLLWHRISSMVTLTLLAVAPGAASRPNCLELFGFDVLVDAGFRPWLLEVNHSPALTLDCLADVAVKKALIGDLIDMMNYTPADRLREGAYRGRGRGPIRPRAPIGGDPEDGSQALKSPRRPDAANQRKSRQRAAGGLKGRLPPVHATRGRIINTNATRADADQTPGVTPGPRETRPAGARRLTTDGRRPRVSEVAAAAAAAAAAATSCRLPDIRSAAARRPDPSAPGRGAPPPRVGGFIRTFPFNRATLRASRRGPDVRAVVRELRELSARLAASPAAGRRLRATDAGEDLGSLLWGPADPPLIRSLSASDAPD